MDLSRKDAVITVTLTDHEQEVYEADDLDLQTCVQDFLDACVRNHDQAAFFALSDEEKQKLLSMI